MNSATCLELRDDEPGSTEVPYGRILGVHFATYGDRILLTILKCAVGGEMVDLQYRANAQATATLMVIMLLTAPAPAPSWKPPGMNIPSYIYIPATITCDACRYPN